MVGIGVAVMIFDQIVDIAVAFNQDVVQAFDLFLIPLGAFLIIDGGLGLWQAIRLRRILPSDKS
jgi:uncharacterized membrane protein